MPITYLAITPIPIPSTRPLPAAPVLPPVLPPLINRPLGFEGGGGLGIVGR